MSNNRFLKKAGLYLIGNISSKFLALFLVPIYAFFLDVSDFGEFDFSQTIMLVVVPIIYCAIWEGILRYLLLKEAYVAEILSSTVAFTFFVTLISVICFFVLQKWLEGLFPNYLMTVLMFVTYGLATIWQYFARGIGESQTYVLSSVVSVFINFIVTLMCLLVFKLGIASLYLGFILGQLCIIIVIEFRVKMLAKFSFSKIDINLLKKMLLFSLPLVSNLVSMWLISGFGRTLVVSNLGAEANGLYAFANKFSIFINVLGSVVSMALIEESILKSKDEQLSEYFTNMINMLFSFFGILSVLLLPAVSLFYSFIDTTVYYTSLVYVPFLLVYSVIITMSTNVASTFQALNKTKYIFITTILGAFVTVVLSMSLISNFGILGVIVGQISGAFVMLLSRIMLVNRFVNLKIDYFKLLLLAILFLIVAAISINSRVIVNVILELLLLLIIYFTQRKFIIGIVRSSLKRRK